MNHEGHFPPPIAEPGAVDGIQTDAAGGWKVTGFTEACDVRASTQGTLRFLPFESRPRMRYATAEQHVATATIQNDQHVAVILEAANRDTRRWEQADVFNPLREKGANMEFGHGPHQCLGQNMARLEINAVFSNLFLRLPRLALDDQHPLEAENSTVTNALRALWVVSHA